MDKKNDGAALLPYGAWGCRR